MRTWWASLNPGWREAAVIAGVGFPVSYLLYIATGVAAAVLGVPINLVGYGAGWTAMGLLCGAFGAGIGYKVALRLESRRSVPVDPKEE